MKRILLIGLLLAATKIYSQTITTNAATNVTQTTATLNASSTGLDAGTTYVVRFHYAIPPSGYTTANSIYSLTFTGGTSNTFTANIVGLTMNSTYKCRARLYYLDGEDEVLITSNEMLSCFTTAGIAAPSITTTAATSITTSAATIGGNITSDGGAAITERGTCYSILDNSPTIGETNVNTFIDQYDLTGIFTNNLQNLKPGVIYYYNAYAINSVDTTYGTATSFTTTSIAQASNVAFNNTTVSQTGITFNAGGGTGRLIVAKQGSASTATPTDGANYTTSNIFGQGSNIGDNTYVINQGSITSLTMSGLTAATAYYIKVYEYTNYPGGGFYYQPSPATGNVTTLKGEPTTQATNVGIGSIMATTFTTSWTRGNGDGVVVVAKASSAIGDIPMDGTTYSANTSFGSGSTIGTGEYVIYIGSGTSVDVTNLIDGTSYYIRVFEYNNSGTNINYLTSSATNNPNSAITQGPATWQGDDLNNPTLWGLAANWSTSEIPTSSRTVIIPSGAPVMPIITTGTRASGNLTIEAGASLTINDGTSLTVSGNLLLESPASSGAAGQLVIPGTGTISVSGTSTMERYYATTSGNWRLVSSPTASPSLNPWFGYYANSWDATIQSWHNLTLSDNLVPVQGISVKDTSLSKTINFTGTFNNVDKSIGVYFTSGTEGGWNLVGNPFPSAIDWGIVDNNLTNIQAAAYVYNGSSYSMCNPCIIAAGQGFMIHASANSTLNIPNASRVANSQSFLKNGLVEGPKINLVAKNDYYSAKAFLSFDPNATNDYDLEFDALMLFSTNDSIADVYTKISNGSKLVLNTLNLESINSLPQNGLVIPVGLTTGANGAIEISAAEISNIPTHIYIYLHDKQFDKYIDLRQDSYKLQIAYNSDTRFELLITQTAVSNKEINNLTPDIFIYTQHKTAFVKSTLFEQNKGEIQVFDIMGRLLSTQHTRNSNIQEVPLQKAGTYIIKIIVNNTVATQKVVVN